MSPTEELMISLSNADKELLEIAARPGGLHVYPGSDYRTDVDVLTRAGFLQMIESGQGYPRWHLTETGRNALSH